MDRDFLLSIVNMATRHYQGGDSIFTLIDETGYHKRYEEVSEKEIAVELKQNPTALNNWWQLAADNRADGWGMFKRDDENHFHVAYWKNGEWTSDTVFSDRVVACASWIMKELEFARQVHEREAYATFKKDEAFLGSLVSISTRFLQGEKSMLSLVKESGYFKRHLEVTRTVVADGLRKNPKALSDWWQIAEDSRSDGWRMFKGLTLCQVAYLDGQEYTTYLTFPDEINACAFYIMKQLEFARQMNEREASR